MKRIAAAVFWTALRSAVAIIVRVVLRSLGVR